MIRCYTIQFCEAELKVINFIRTEPSLVNPDPNRKEYTERETLSEGQIHKLIEELYDFCERVMNDDYIEEDMSTDADPEDPSYYNPKYILQMEPDASLLACDLCELLGGSEDIEYEDIPAFLA